MATPPVTDRLGGKHLISRCRSVCGVAGGTVLAAARGYLRTARHLLDSSVEALRPIPSLAWAPLFILWFGIFETSKIALISVSVFFPAYLPAVSTWLGWVGCSWSPKM